MTENKENPKISKAQQKAVQKYVKNNYDRVVLTLPKGKRDLIKEHAKNKKKVWTRLLIGLLMKLWTTINKKK